MKKIMTTLLTLAVAVGLILGVEKMPSVSAAEGSKKAVFSIDAGRKYFSEEQLKQIIDKAYKNGYTDVQILLGNDALRFFLDDMTIVSNGTTYTSENVKEALTKGNEHYYKDPNGNALTEAEMDGITAYAKERGLNIIPVINSPGHMDSILKAMDELGIDDARYSQGDKVSERTVNIENEDAVAFTKALVKKYVQYFSKTGVTEIFNFGADEYANDVFTEPGWGELQRLGLYGKFIEYANDMAAIIKETGMRPMCFNDGIYYNSKDEYGVFDKDIIISYWTAGWWGFYVAKPAYFVEKGHEILNTNDAWYWVLGNIENGGYPFVNTMKNIEAKNFTDVTGAAAGESIPIIGSMQCVWCDDPSKAHDMDRIMQLMDAYSEKHADVLVRPADYSGIQAVLNTIPEDLTSYTEESSAHLEEVIAGIPWGLKVTEQNKVDQYAQELKKAVEALEKVADYSKVDAAIKKVETLKEEDYKDFSKVTAAIESVKRGLGITRQDEVDVMAKRIEDAIAALEKKTPAEATKPETTMKPDSSATVNKKSPKTGDMAAVGGGMVTMILAIGAVSSVVIRRKK